MFALGSVRPLFLYPAVGLLAGAVITLQICIMRIFAVGSWAHFGSLVVSLAMLGFGLASAIMCVATNWFERHWRGAAATDRRVSGFPPSPVFAQLERFAFARGHCGLLGRKHGERLYRIDIDTDKLDAAIGVKGKVNGGVYQFSVPRKEPITEDGMLVPPAMGTSIAINLQPTGGGKAAITGDFVVTAEEVNPMIRALRENGIEVTALHSHMLDEQPRLFFVHFWANDDAVKLTKGLQAALQKIAVARG